MCDDVNTFYKDIFIIIITFIIKQYFNAWIM